MTIAAVKADILSALVDLQAAATKLDSALTGLDELSPVNPDTGKVWISGGSLAQAHDNAYSPSLKMHATVGASGSLSHTSDRGKTWSSVSVGGDLRCIEWAEWLGAFVMASKTGGLVATWSPSAGVTTYTTSSNEWHDIAVDEARQIAVIVAQNGGSDRIAFFSDPASITTLVPPSPGNVWHSVAKPAPGRDEFFILAEGGDANRVLMFDGVSQFTQHTAPQHGWKANDWFDADGHYISVSSAGQAMRTTPDGSVSTLIPISGGLWHNVEAGDSIAVAVNETGTAQVATLEPLATSFEDQIAPSSAWQGASYDAEFDTFVVTSRSGASMFSPDDAAPPPPPTPPGGSLEVWLKGDQLTESSGLVSEWADQSGNARNMTASGGDMPIYNATGGPNSKPIIEGLGNSAMDSPAFDLTPPVHIFMVMRVDSYGNSDRAFSCENGDIELALTGSQIHINSGSASTAHQTLTPGTFYLLQAYFSGSTDDFTALNDGAKITGVNAGTALFDSGFTLFNRSDHARPSDISLAEVRVYTGEVTGVDLDDLLVYFNTEYMLW